MKKCIFFLAGILCLALNGIAQTQPCATDEVHRRMIVQHPEIQKIDADLENQIRDGLKHIDYRRAAKTTTTDESGNKDFWYDIPIVIHLIHDYGTEYVADDSIFKYLKDWNIVYAKQNYDTAMVIPTFRPWIGNVHIRLHLATRDPNGNPTKGITHHRSYLTYFGGEQAKLDDWANTSYVNIWAVNTMSVTNFEAAAYALFPSAGAADPYGDGIICLYNYLADAYDGSPNAVSKTIPHEMGHVFNLEHVWGNTNNPGVACGDDNVDDTPPTMGHSLGGCTPASLYDTACAFNYFKIYTSVSGADSLVNYPDTANAQNIMDYTYCARMFTKGQAERMHATLNTNVAGRDNLWDSVNLAITGALAGMPDLLPVPDFSATSSTPPSLGSYTRSVNYFTFPGASVIFHNESYNDTLESVAWSFSNSASIPSVINSGASVHNIVTNSFTDPGWVSLTLKATGNNTGESSMTWPRAVFVADANALDPGGYLQEFSGADTAKWPMFNYYNNEFHWQYANAGMYDNSCVMYTGFDTRIDVVNNIYPITGCPYGDFDDFFSIPVDLSGFSGTCFLNYYYSGASRTSRATDINDELDIDYSVNKGAWNSLAKLTKASLCNKGALATAYTPAGPQDWAPMAVSIPPAARSPYTVFRFRYKPGVGVGPDGTQATGSYSSGNNFYLDRLNFGAWPAGVEMAASRNNNVCVAPNPTNGDAWVVVSDAAGEKVNVVVTDITGKTVWSAQQVMPDNKSHMEIPQTAISAKGMYIVEVVTGRGVTTRKLVVD